MKYTDKTKLIVIAGPTACGKSDIAIDLARRFDGEIISADSRQVYKGMDIGTGKVTKKEQRMAKHWLLDTASPKSQYSAAKWKSAGQRAIKDIGRRGKLPVVCGGTGFWIDSLVYDLALPNVKPNIYLRQKLNRLSADQMYIRLRKLDPIRAASIDRHNPRRLLRALEIILSTGQPVPPLSSAHKNSKYSVLYLAITYPKNVLVRRIALRLDKRLKSGMLAEVRHLHDQRISWKRLESFGLEDKWLARFLQGKVTRQEMRGSLLHDIIAYSRRQMTWLKRNKDIVWIDGQAQAQRETRHFLNT